MVGATLCVMARTKDRRLYAAEAAELAGVARGTWNTYVARRLPVHNPAPERDGTEVDGAHARPWWWESRVKAWIKDRPGSPGRPRDAG